MAKTTKSYEFNNSCFSIKHVMLSRLPFLVHKLSYIQSRWQFPPCGEPPPPQPLLPLLYNKSIWRVSVPVLSITVLLLMRSLVCRALRSLEQPGDHDFSRDDLLWWRRRLSASAGDTRDWTARATLDCSGDT